MTRRRRTGGATAIAARTIVARAIAGAAIAASFVFAASGGAHAGPQELPAAGPDCVECPHHEAPATLGATLLIPTTGLEGSRLIVVGTVYRPDGRSPAAGVLVYAYHTNPSGIYPKPPGATGMARWHGALRGWLRTGADGRYRIETLLPGAYPNSTIPAHIHMHVMPPGGRERWIDDITFADDALVDAGYQSRARDIGASHLVRPTRDAAGVLHVTRDIVLPE